VVPLDRSMTSFYGLSKVTMFVSALCTGLAAILIAKLLLAVITYACEELLYRILALIVASDIATSP